MNGEIKWDSFIQQNTIWQQQKNEVLIPTTTQMNLENIRLCNRSQSQKITYCVILYEMFK